MSNHPFDQPVPITLVDGGWHIRNVTTTRDAAEILLYRWPNDGGRKHLAARKACLAVLEGSKEARVARRAFEAAAKEADIFHDPAAARAKLAVMFPGVIPPPKPVARKS